MTSPNVCFPVNRPLTRRFDRKANVMETKNKKERVIKITSSETKSNKKTAEQDNRHDIEK